MQCKDIPDEPILRVLLNGSDGYAGHGWHDLYPREKFCPTIRDAFPKGCSDKLILSKMRSLINRDLVDGCACGCRGDFRITEKGRLAVFGAGK